MQNNLPQTAQNQHIATTSNEKFLKLYNPANCLSFVHKLTNPLIAAESKAPSLSVVRKDFGEDFTQHFLMAWLVYLNDMLNLNKPMNEPQITLCASTILKEYNYLKISDLSLLFHRIITGQYGEFYQSLSIAKVLTFFREYEAERTELIVQKAQYKHREFRYQEDKNQTQLDFFKRQVKKIHR